jgi:hypothetical protein
METGLGPDIKYQYVKFSLVTPIHLLLYPYSLPLSKNCTLKFNIFLQNIFAPICKDEFNINYRKSHLIELNIEEKYEL